jgi:hypothetical protein
MDGKPISSIGEREFFAAIVLHALVSTESNDPVAAAKAAVDHADALITALKANPETRGTDC